MPHLAEKWLTDAFLDALRIDAALES